MHEELRAITDAFKLICSITSENSERNYGKWRNFKMRMLISDSWRKRSNGILKDFTAQMNKKEPLLLFGM